jgi:hypothetical protein
MIGESAKDWKIGDSKAPQSSSRSSRRAPLVVVPHRRQRASWDCGVACGLMVALWKEVPDVSYESVLQALGTKSVWTVELGLVLADVCGLGVEFYSEVLGMNQALASDGFYKEDWDDDEKRVHALLPRARECSRYVLEEKTVSMDYLVSRLDRGHKAIVLADKRSLRCTQCDGMFTSLVGLLTREFAGHFVVLCGTSADRKRVIAVDPAQEHSACQIELSVLEEARKANGTDQDILFIS